MESTLHRRLKARFGPDLGGRSEVVVDGYRIDAVGPDGVLVEVQTGHLGPLRDKLRRLLEGHRVRVVKPVALRTRVVRRKSLDGPDLSARFSPKRGRISEVFDDIVGLAGVFPHENLAIEVLAVEVEEIRLPRRRWPGYVVADRRLLDVFSPSIALVEPADLWRLLPAMPEGRFSTLDLAERLACSREAAQRVAYVLRRAGAAEVVGKAGNRRLYLACNDGAHEAMTLTASRKSVLSPPAESRPTKAIV